MLVAVGDLEIVDDFALVPDVIAGGDYIDAQFEQFFGERRSDAEAAGRIFAVGDHEIDGVIFHEPRQAVLDDVSPGTAENVANEENSHKEDSRW